MVNKYYGQTFEEWLEEMLIIPSQSVLPVLWAFGRETTFGRNSKRGRMNLESSTIIVAKYLTNDLKKCWQNRLKVCFQCFVPSVEKPLLAGIGSVEEWICNYCGQTFDEWFEEMLTTPSLSVLPVLCAFGRETTFGRNSKRGRMNFERSTIIVTTNLKKCWQNCLKVCFKCSVSSTQKPLLGNPLFLPQIFQMEKTHQRN